MSEWVDSPSARRSERAGRQFGYLVSAGLSLVGLFVVNNVLSWEVSWITARFADVINPLNMSLLASVIGNGALIVTDPRWFRHIVQFVINIFALIAMWAVYSVFPFDLPAPWDWVLPIVMLFAMFGVVLGTIIEFFRGMLPGRQSA